MGAAIGAGLGLLLGAGMGHLKAKHEQEAKAKEMEAELFKDIVAKNPHAIESPEFQKTFKKFYGQEGVDLISGINNMRKAAIARVPAGFGGAPPAETPSVASTAPPSAAGQVIAPPAPAAAPTGLPEGMTREKFQTLSEEDKIAYVKRASAAGPTAAMRGTDGTAIPAGQVAMPSELETLRREVQQGQAFINSDDFEGLDERHQKIIQATLERYQKRLDELEKEQRAPELKKREKLAEYDPEVTKARAGAEATVRKTVAEAEKPVKISTAAGEAAASTSARLRVEGSDAAIDADARKAAAKAVAEFKAKRTAESSVPPTKKEEAELRGKLETRAKDMIANYAATHPGGWTTAAARTPAFKFYAASTDDEVARLLFAVPEGAVFKGEHTKDGSPVYRLPDGKAWTPD